MNDQTPRTRGGRLTRLLREQSNDMMAAAYGLGEILASNERGLNYLAVINRCLCRQLRLATYLELEYLLSGEDEVRLDFAPLELVELCAALMEQVERVVRPLEIKVEFCPKVERLFMNADGARLEDLLLCLISNSVEAIGSRGTVRLTVERREDRVLLLLTDDGGGASPRAMAGFFGQDGEEDPLARESGGLGLGLPLARRIAALHGGMLLADTYEGEGMRLAVTLPITEPDAGGCLRSRPPAFARDGWSRALVELSHCLPARAFLPKEVDG